MFSVLPPENSTWKHGRLAPVYRKPFDFLVENYQRAKKASEESVTKISVNEIWLPIVEGYRTVLIGPTLNCESYFDTVGNFR
jgi:hypothetical protein